MTPDSHSPQSTALSGTLSMGWGIDAGTKCAWNLANTHSATYSPTVHDRTCTSSLQTAPMVECPATEPRRPLLTRRPPPLPTELVSFAQQPEACGVDDEERATERSSRPNSLMPLLVALPPQTPTTITVAMLPRKIVLHISRFVDPVTLVKVRYRLMWLSPTRVCPT